MVALDMRPTREIQAPVLDGQDDNTDTDPADVPADDELAGEGAADPERPYGPAPRGKSRHSAELRQEIVGDMARDGRTVQYAARYLGIPKLSVRRIAKAIRAEFADEAGIGDGRDPKIAAVEQMLGDMLFGARSD